MKDYGRLFTVSAAALAGVLLWGVVVALAAREGWGRSAVARQTDSQAFMSWAEHRYELQSKGDFAMALIDHGKVVATTFASHGHRISERSLFQVASLSKWVTAWGVMRLVQEGRIDLDAPVSRYLTRWRLPQSRYDNDGVTVRRLLSHTAGLTDDLGFVGYPASQTPPNIEQELTHTADAWPGRSGIIRVGAKPGDAWRYSGGGYLILQLLIEEVTHKPFNEYMRGAVLRPLGMADSTFVDPNESLLADNFAADGTIAPRYRFTALGAASLYASTADLIRFLQAQTDVGGPVGRGVLAPATLASMRKPTAFLFGIPVWGLGECLFAPKAGGSYVIGHDGGNSPAINTTARVDPNTGDGVVVLETGETSLAAEIGGEWTYWNTGVVPVDTLVRFSAPILVTEFALGAVVILFIALGLNWRPMRKAPKA